MKIALIGLGRTGKLVAEYLLDKGMLSMVLCRKGSKDEQTDIGGVLGRKDTGLCIETTDNLEMKLFHYQPEVLIDFSGPEFLRENIHLLDKCGVRIVTAVTDYTVADIEKFKCIVGHGRIGMIMVPNITYGVNVMMLLVRMAAELMDEYDFEIIEEHHNQKKDIPSGTAKKIAYKIDERLTQRDNLTPVHSIRSGSIVGKHKVIIAGKYDKVEISHESFSRLAFAEGAYKAARFIHQKVGFYEMEDVFDHSRAAAANGLDLPPSKIIALAT